MWSTAVAPEGPGCATLRQVRCRDVNGHDEVLVPGCLKTIVDVVHSDIGSQGC